MRSGELQSDQVVGRGFGLLELMIVVVILAVLTTAAAPVYHGYALEAKTVEAKLVAASLWTAVTASALGGCGTAVAVSGGYARAGLSATGATALARWAVTDGGGSNSIIMDCGIGTITPEGDVFTVSGTAADVNAIRVKLSYVAARSPSARLRCSTDGGRSFTDC